MMRLGRKAAAFHIHCCGPRTRTGGRHVGTVSLMNDTAADSARHDE